MCVCVVGDVCECVCVVNDVCVCVCVCVCVSLSLCASYVRVFPSALVFFLISKEGRYALANNNILTSGGDRLTSYDSVF